LEDRKVLYGKILATPTVDLRYALSRILLICCGSRGCNIRACIPIVPDCSTAAEAVSAALPCGYKETSNGRTAGRADSHGEVDLPSAGLNVVQTSLDASSIVDPGITTRSRSARSRCCRGRSGVRANDIIFWSRLVSVADQDPFVRITAEVTSLGSSGSISLVLDGNRRCGSNSQVKGKAGTGSLCH